MSLGIMGVPAGKIKNIQRGKIVIALNQTTNTDTINASVLAKSVVNIVGFTTSQTNEDYAGTHPYLELTDTTTVTVTRGVADAAITTTASYEVIEVY